MTARYAFSEMIYEGMDTAYLDLAGYILDAGELVSPRGEATYEIRAASFQIEDAVRRGVPIGLGRKVGRKMQAIDGSGNLAGASYPDVATRLAPVLDRFADDLAGVGVTPAIALTANAPWGGRFFQGAYGPRMGPQLLEVEEQLRRDPSTRQAVVSLWREEDRNPFWADRPCTTEVQFMLRDDGLHVFVFMRANDLWTGTCYDVWQFGQLQAALAHVLGVPVGPYHHYATSLHIYERDADKFRDLLELDRKAEQGTEEEVAHAVSLMENPRETPGPDWGSLEPGWYTSMAEIQDRFRLMLASLREAGPSFEVRNPVEDWYYEILKEAKA